MASCHLSPHNKKAYIRNVGRELVRTQGRRKFYRPSQIVRAANDLNYPVDILCWAYCFYLTPADFKKLHDATGEVCDYAAMKAEILADLVTGVDGSAIGDALSAASEAFTEINLEMSWLDLLDGATVIDWFDASP
jgi:hypothetical protein